MDGELKPPRLLHEFFERAVARHPEGIAIDVPASDARPRRRVTYAELDERVHTIARHVARCTQPGDVVAIHVPRHDVDAFAAQLAVMKAGCAYTCIDPGFPDAHASFILEDANAKVLLTDRAGAARARAAGFRVPHVVELSDLAQLQHQNSRPHAGPADLAYLIYTSGTTGRPKGVMIEHRSIVNLIASDVDYFALSATDRVAQNSSHAYDSAIEETWLAFSAAATLVVLDDETARRGPDLIPWLRRERISVFCPPPTMLRATGCKDPGAELPDLRLVYVGGEALPRDIADRWAPGRHLENGYGPTECAVTALRTRIHEHELITIGTPVRGNHALVLDEDGSEIDDDSPGELCLSGIGVARGYLNRPELTAAKFPEHPRHGRIYRTGDLVRRDGDSRFLYLGRIDAQVKLRGFRIELTAIESLLAAQPGVRAAACTVQEESAGPILVAHVVPAEAGAPDRHEEWRASLGRELPAYMVPARIALVAELPVTVGGKLDRARLPRVDARAPAASRTIVQARNDVERAVRDAFRSALGLAADPSTDDDFFVDLGGDSLRAAEAISELRGNAATEHLTVRDIYSCRTIARVAAVAPAPHAARATKAPARVSEARRLLSNVIQISVLVAFVVLVSGGAWWLGERIVPPVAEALGLPLMLALTPLVFGIGIALYAPFAVVFAVVVKRVLIGRYVAARVPVFSGLYVRHWLVQKAASCIPWGSISGTEFECAALRALGARIGRRVHVHRGVALALGGWDLLELGDDVSIAQDAALRLVDLEDGELVIGPIRVGSGSTVDVRASMSAHSSLGANAELTALTWLPPGVHVPDGRRFGGVPAEDLGPASGAEPLTNMRSWSPRTHAFALAACRAGARLLFALPLTLALVTFALVTELDWPTLATMLAEGTWTWSGALWLAVAVCAAAPVTLVLQALFLRAIGRVHSGSASSASPAHLRISLKTDAVHEAGVWLAGALFWPMWLRLAGMRVARDVEVSTIVDVVPELVELGPESFLADGIYLGGPRIHRGVVTAAHTSLGARTFLGNHVVVRAGHRLPNDLLVGVCTVTDPATMTAGSAWFGHPPFALPRRVPTDIDRRLTHKPSFVRRFNRVVWELARFAVPAPPIFVALWAAGWIAAIVASDHGLLEESLRIAGVVFAVAALGVLSVLALKWLLLGRVRPGQHALWSCWCSRWDFHYVLWERYARSILISLEGTALIAWYLRAMGARIGRRVVLSEGFAQVVDPDMLEFEDDVTVHALFQAHSFEDRMLKIDRIVVGRRADVGQGAVLFFGARIGEGAKVLPHSVVMKREQVLPSRVYVGCPVRAE